MVEAMTDKGYGVNYSWSATAYTLAATSMVAGLQSLVQFTNTALLQSRPLGQCYQLGLLCFF